MKVYIGFEYLGKPDLAFSSEKIATALGISGTFPVKLDYYFEYFCDSFEHGYDHIEVNLGNCGNVVAFILKISYNLLIEHPTCNNKRKCSHEINRPQCHPRLIASHPRQRVYLKNCGQY